MSVTASLIVNAVITHKQPLDHGDAEYPIIIKNQISLANGNLANQANQVFSDQRTLTGSTSEELDLAGSLLDAFGNTITFTKIKAIIISAAAANGGDIEVGGSATNGFNDWVGAVGDLVKVKPGGAFAIIAPDLNGYAVTAATADLLKINNADAGSATYDITIVGVE